MSSEPKISPRTYLPVALSLTLTWILTLLSKQARLTYPRPAITPLQEPAPTAPPSQALTSPGPYLNALIVIGLIAISGVVVLYIARKRPRLFRLLTGTLIWLISFGITVIYVLNLALAFDLALLRLWMPISILAASIITYVIYWRGEIAAALASSYIASGAGGAIGMSIPYWTFLTLVAGISIYDVFAVYKGHLSTLSKDEALSLKGLTVEVGDVVIGLGDLFFYSLTVSAILWNLGFLPALAATAAVLAGFSIILLSLRRKRMIPGLPIPLLASVVLAFFVKLLFQ
ncbi:MAG: hypothetical protein J7J94_00050 [Thaumarchaeota archaeon]|nr:hypothetical protein [Nitrososphaerota archaeon]